jgi:hypothetical protein
MTKHGWQVCIYRMEPRPPHSVRVPRRGTQSASNTALKRQSREIVSSKLAASAAADTPIAAARCRSWSIVLAGRATSRDLFPRIIADLSEAEVTWAGGRRREPGSWSNVLWRWRRLIWSREHLTRKVPNVQPNSAAISAEVKPRSSSSGICLGSILLGRLGRNAATRPAGAWTATGAEVREIAVPGPAP